MFENFNPASELIPSDLRFGCGPSVICDSYVQKLVDTKHSLLGTSHRKTPVKNLVKDIQEGLRSFFNLPKDYDIILGNGGATMFFDMVSLGAVEKSTAHFVCGEFSQRWSQASQNIPWIEAKEKKVSLGEGIVPEDVEGCDTLCMTLNETSTGVQLPSVPSIAAGNKIVAIDATSGAGQIPCDLKKVDIFFFSPQKVFGSEGGLWVAIMSPKAVERVNKVAADKSRYIPQFMNFVTNLENGRKNQTFTTPSISTLFFLREQVHHMAQQGSQKVYDEAEKKANFLYGWANTKDYLSPFIKEDHFRSRSVATICVDDKYNVNDLLKRLEKLGLVLGIEPYRKIGGNQFRIAFFHNITFQNIEKLTKLLSAAIENAL